MIGEIVRFNLIGEYNIFIFDNKKYATYHLLIGFPSCMLICLFGAFPNPTLSNKDLGPVPFTLLDICLGTTILFGVFSHSQLALPLHLLHLVSLFAERD